MRDPGWLARRGLSGLVASVLLAAVARGHWPDPRIGPEGLGMARDCMVRALAAMRAEYEPPSHVQTTEYCPELCQAMRRVEEIRQRQRQDVETAAAIRCLEELTK